MDQSIEVRQKELESGLARELATVVSALLGSNAAAVLGHELPVGGWTVNCAISGALSGRITLAIGEDDASSLARRLMGMDEPPASDAVVDTLGEVVSQAVGSLSQQPAAAGTKIRIEGAATLGGPRPDAPPAVFVLEMEDGSSLRVATWIAIEALESEEPILSASVASMPLSAVVSAVAPPSRAASAEPQPGLENLEVILDIDLPLTVRFGRAEMTLAALTQISPGSVIDLDRPPDEPVDVLIDDRVIARGEVVVVAGNYGVRVTEVISAVDRIKSLGA
jgi:flagellar motor switch protein FliN